MFIFERSNGIFSINIFWYFIVNTVTIVSTLLLQKRYKAFEYHNSVFYCLSWKITGSKICQHSRINLACTKIPITTGFNVYSSTLLPFGQLCYPRKWAMSTLLPAYNWPFHHGYYGYKLDIAHMCSRDILFSLNKILLIRNKIWLYFEQCTEAICTSLPVGRWFHPDLGEIIWVFLIHYFSTQ